jgi:lipopolysaccharide export LptBFGC system permease protein LptF
LETVLPPVLAAWAPNVIYGCAGLYLLLFVRT